MSALMTTFGVGELSAINGIAGAYSEQIPVVHIVGTPSTISQRGGQLLHHTLGNGDFNVFANMNEGISCEVAKLHNPADIATQIDYALAQCWIRSRPVYITLPTDMVDEKIEGERLRTPIDLSSPKNDADREEYVVDVILRTLYSAKDPIILVDACAIRHKVGKETLELIEKTGLPYFLTPMGKGVLDETHPQYGGIYAGVGSRPDINEKVEGSDLILFIGALKVGSRRLSQGARATSFHHGGPVCIKLVLLMCFSPPTERLQHCRVHLPDLAAQHDQPPQHPLRDPIR
jgi:pyruvate decarboxylase